MDLTTALQRIFEDSRTNYTLSFDPAALDGTYHELKVKVARRGVDVFSRQGYLAGAEPQTGSSLPGSKALNIGWITFSATRASDRKAQEDRQVLTAGPSQSIPAAGNPFDDSDGLFFSTEIYARSLAEKANSVIALAYRVVDRNTGVQKYSSGEAGLKEYIRPGSPVIPFVTRIRSESLKPGSYRLEVTVHDTAAPEYVVRTADFEIADEHHD
jgi:hypothetical protein